MLYYLSALLSLSTVQQEKQVSAGATQILIKGHQQQHCRSKSKLLYWSCCTNQVWKLQFTQRYSWGEVMRMRLCWFKSWLDKVDYIHALYCPSNKTLPSSDLKVPVRLISPEWNLNVVHIFYFTRVCFLLGFFFITYRYCTALAVKHHQVLIWKCQWDLFLPGETWMLFIFSILQGLDFHCFWQTNTQTEHRLSLK